jgi:hypothetical protein
MKTARLFVMTIILPICFATTTYSNNLIPQSDKDFTAFVEQFTASASFQYSRIKFPLKSPITLMADDGKSEKTIVFTKDKWPLLSADILKEKNESSPEGGTYIAKYVVDQPAHKEFQAGYEDSEIDLKIVFDLINGKWYVTDCYTAWYNFELSMEEFRDAVIQVQRENAAFIKIHP